MSLFDFTVPDQPVCSSCRRTVERKDTWACMWCQERICAWCYIQHGLGKHKDKYR